MIEERVVSPEAPQVPQVPAEVKQPHRPKEVAHDEAPAIVNDHAFEPRNPKEWWGRCKHCSLYEAAHRETTTNSRELIRYYSDDNPDD